MDWFAVLLRAAQKPLDALFGAEQRVFLPFLGTSAAIAAIVWAVVVRPRGRTSLLGFLFPRAVWLHRSALLDYRLLFLRALLSLLLVVPVFLSTIAVAVEVSRALRHTVGMSSLQLARPWIMALFTLAAFVIDDLTRYVVHRVMHRVPFLWELHKVHHSAEVMTPFTLQRVHPIEGFVMAVRASATLGLVSGVFIWLFPGKVQIAMVLGVDVITFGFAALGANLRHSHVWLSYGPIVERVLISPAQHQIHHSVERAHYDKNYGAALAVWDWMFRSLYVPRGRERITFGLAGEKNHRDTVVSLVIDPMVASARALVPRRSRRAATPAE